MKDTTVKLSGHAKDRFLERYFAEEPGLAAEMARRLAQRSKSTFTSVRVPKAAMSVARRRPVDLAQAPAEAAAIAAPVPTTAAQSSAPPPVTPPTAFDPYVFGLVPVFQREGRDGLIAKLAAIDRLDHLRQMAKAQQIVLPQELRTSDAAPDAVRAAIADAVAKRVADRRAAAG